MQMLMVFDKVSWLGFGDRAMESAEEDQTAKLMHDRKWQCKG